MIKKFAALVMAIFVMMVIASCAAGPAKPLVNAPPSAPTVEVEETVDSPTRNEMVREFGETMEWADGLSISVSTPTEFETTEWAMGEIEGFKNVYFHLTMTNNTGEPYDPMLFTNISSGGKEGSMIFDSGNPLGEFMASPKTVILPGQTVEWISAYSIADIDSIVLELEPGFQYKNAIFTNIN